MLGLEINHYAAELARTALWIGYIQWHHANGFRYTQQPLLIPLDTIRQTDAILDLTDPDNPAEPEWPAAEFIVGNPPFFGWEVAPHRIERRIRGSTVQAIRPQSSGRNQIWCVTGSTKHSARSKRGKPTVLAYWRRRGYGAAPTGEFCSASRKPGHFHGVVGPSVGAGRRGGAHLDHWV